MLIKITHNLNIQTHRLRFAGGGFLHERIGVSYTPSVILSGVRSTESNFCGMKCPSREQDTE